MKLHYEEEGVGRPFAILHGLMGSCENWRAIRHALAGCFRVICLDLPNHGLSPRQDVFTMATMADDVTETLDAAGAPEAVVAGHSLGGKVAMQMASCHPERVSALVVVDMSPQAFPPVHLFALRACQALPVATATRRFDLDEELAKSIPQQVTRNFLLKNVTRTPDGHYAWRVPLDALIANYATVSDALPLSRAYRGPALFVLGGKSPFRFWEDETVVKTWFPRAIFSVIPDAGHLVHVDCPDTFLSSLRNFLGCQPDFCQQNAPGTPPQK